VIRCCFALLLSILIISGGADLSLSAAGFDGTQKRGKDRKILLGTSCALSGPVAALGVDLYRGSRAYFDLVNQNGGIHGRSIQIIIYDDGYEPQYAVRNTIRLIQEDKVFLLFGYVGTPTLTKVLPLLRVFKNRDIYNFAPFTGARPQRIPPYDRYVINIRASYEAETTGLVNYFLNRGYRRIGFLGQADAYGKSGEYGVKKTLARYRLDITGCATYSRNIPFSADMREQVKILRDSGAEVVIIMGAYAPGAAFIRDAREMGWDIPIANVSFAATDVMLDLLIKQGAKTGKDYTSNLISSQVVPSYEDLSLPAIREYRELMDNSHVEIPQGMKPRTYNPRLYSFASLEGFINAKVLTEVLQRMGQEMDAKRLMTTVEAMTEYDVGIGIPVRFGPNKHQGLDAIYLMVVKDNRWVPLTE